MSLQTNADIFFANVNFRNRPHDLGNAPDISICGPERLFASFSHAAISNPGQGVPPIITCAKPRRTPSLVLQTDCPSVHLDGAQLLHVRQVGGLDLTLLPIHSLRFMIPMNSKAKFQLTLRRKN
ncbi:hypothetical protein CWE07_04005 [Aliidiomarina maris]|uniref:Uncharacterized protein n=1 Tax=Aliidiomarina maris TaxID=531312 RepID=A0ABY0BUE2_9GAMM|nr:hypothetical protein CWE07_04005 [Aliidiomarina maris]